jgi:hypothetical protein
MQTNKEMNEQEIDEYKTLSIDYKRFYEDQTNK